MFAEYALHSPELLSTLRILPSSLDFYSNKLDDASPAHELKLARMVKDNYAMLQRYDRGALDRPGQLSYDVLGFFLSMQVEGEPFRFHDFPVNQMEGIQNPSENSQIPSVTYLTTFPNWNSLRAPWGTAPSPAPWSSENAEEQREPGDAGVVCHIIDGCQCGHGARRDIGGSIGDYQR